LEESLLEFRGALVLVTHDRYMLDRVSTSVLGLDGRGEVEQFADYSQWDAWQRQPQPEIKPVAPQEKRNTGGKKKLSYLEAREFAGIEDRVMAAEEEVAREREVVEDPAVATDAVRLQTALLAMERAQAALDELYARWAELEAKSV
jgi:ATP-binding cassette subfamily F protein uup